MTKILAIGIAVVVLAWLGWASFGNRTANEDTMMKSNEAAMEKPGDAMMQDKGAGDTMMKDESATTEKTGDTMMKKDEGAMMDTGDAMAKSGTYEAYSPEKLALASSGKVLLFFHATWCPICRGIEAEIKSDLSKIPTGVHILKVDYDTATALKQKYGVTLQHTFVQVDAKGDALKKFSDATTLSGVVARVQ